MFAAIDGTGPGWPAVQFLCAHRIGRPLFELTRSKSGS
jgi:hypothetical protein